MRRPTRGACTVSSAAATSQTPPVAAEQLAPALTGSRRQQPRECARPRERAPAALQHAGEEEGPEAAGEGEAEAREAHRGEADENGPARAEPDRGKATRQAADQRAGRIGGYECTCSSLREAELAGEMRQERSERRKQHRVDENEDR